jgi:antitoxin HicB
MLAYPAVFESEDDGFVVSFPNFPEAITEGNTADEAMEYAVDALQTILSEYINRRMDIPMPRQVRGKRVRWVRLPALAEAKIGVYRAMQANNIRKVDLARRLGWQKSLVDRLLDLRHASRLDQIEIALRALDKQLTVHIEDAA